MSGRTCVLAVVVCLAASAPARAAGDGETTRNLARQLADKVKKVAGGLQPAQTAVRLGLFTASQSLLDIGGGGGAVMAELELALSGFLSPNAPLELKGDILFVDDPNTPGAKVLKLKAKLVDRNGDEPAEFKEFVGFVRANTDIARVTGATVSFKTDKEYLDDKKGPFEGRNGDLQNGLPRPPAGPQEKPQPPKAPAHVDGTLVRARKDSEYAVEVRKKKLGAPGEAKAVAAGADGLCLKDGLAFVPIDKGEVYEVRVLNYAHHEVAVSLSVDGIDQFTFSEDRADLLDGKGQKVLGADGKCVQRPKFSHWVVGPCKDGKPGEVLILGWHKTADPNRTDNVTSFLVTEYGKGAASKFPTRAQGKVGLITVGISRSHPEGTSRSGGETGFGPDRELKQEVVKRVIDPPHEFVTIRYTRNP